MEEDFYHWIEVTGKPRESASQPSMRQIAKNSLKLKCLSVENGKERFATACLDCSPRGKKFLV
jgi:hypothetical protein